MLNKIYYLIIQFFLALWPIRRMNLCLLRRIHELRLCPVTKYMEF